MILARRGLCRVVSSLGGVVSKLMMWLDSFVVFISASGESCSLEGAVVRSLARRLTSEALLRSVLTSLLTVLVQ